MLTELTLCDLRTEGLEGGERWCRRSTPRYKDIRGGGRTWRDIRGGGGEAEATLLLDLMMEIGREEGTAGREEVDACRDEGTAGREEVQAERAEVQAEREEVETEREEVV